jgi:transposase
MNRTQALKQSSFDADQWQKLYYRHPQQYIRKRLDAIKLLMGGQSRGQVAQYLECSYETLSRWIDAYLTSGLEQLVIAITHNKLSRLSVEQQQQLKVMLLTQRPIDYGVERHLWTGGIIAQVIEQRWQVQLKDSRIYEILDELGLSHQRGHRDYANADVLVQKHWVETVKKTASSATR